MKRNICRHILPSLLLSLAAGAVTSCVGEGELTCPEESGETYTLQLQVFTGDSFTRATPIWGDNEYTQIDGSVFDSTISTIDLFLLSNGNVLTRLHALEELPSSSPGSHIFTCQVNGKTPGISIDTIARTATLSGKIMAVANADGSQGVWYDSTDWASQKIPYSIKFGNKPDWYIPMWGVMSFSDQVIRSGEIKMLGELEMLRAVSKIIIGLDDSISDDFEITGISISQDSYKLKGEGYVMPEDALSVEKTDQLARDHCLALRSTAEELSPAIFVKDSSTGNWCTYVSESLTTAANPFKFDVMVRRKIENSTEFTGQLFFSLYDSADPTFPGTTITNVVRNHTYQFTLKLKELVFEPEVEKWEFGGRVHIELE